jgi:hypothetical protein
MYHLCSIWTVPAHEDHAEPCKKPLGLQKIALVEILRLPIRLDCHMPQWRIISSCQNAAGV